MSDTPENPLSEEAHAESIAIWDRLERERLQAAIDANERNRRGDTAVIMLRDHFAGWALAPILRSMAGRAVSAEQGRAEIAEEAYALADAMLAQRAKGKT